MRHLPAAAPPDGHPPLAPRASAAGASPQPAPPGCLWRRDIETRGRPRRPHSPVPKIPGIHRELPGPIHIVAIRQPASS
jgi:hypothetical protein